METIILDDEKKSGTMVLDTETVNESATKVIEQSESGTVVINNNQDNVPKEQIDGVLRLVGEPLTEKTNIAGWIVKEQMNTNSGEADLYLIEKDEKLAVLKYYRGSHKPKLQVVQKIKELKNPCIVKLYDYGFYNDRFFEISEYEKFGNINKKKKNTQNFEYLPLSEDSIFELCKDIVEGFKEFHDKGILHRDIKPENFYVKNSSPLEIVIGDFGISSFMEEGEELHKTKTLSRTSGYAPRELFTADYKGIGPAIDYYALGITLWEFATGGSPFTNLAGQPRSERHIMRDTFEGRIADDLLSRQPRLSPKLQKLIRGLLLVDDKNRWGYSEVTRYLKGEDVPLVEEKKKEISFPVNHVNCVGAKDIANALWKERKKIDVRDLGELAQELENNYFYSWQEIKDIVQDIENPKDIENDLLKIVYLLNPEMSFKPDQTLDYTIASREDVVKFLKIAPEIMVDAFHNTNSSLFTFISLLLGDDTTKGIKEIIKEETAANKEYYDMSDNLFDLRLVTKIRLLIEDAPIKPFKQNGYEEKALYELKDLNYLTKEQKLIVLSLIRDGIFVGDLIPWLELKSGKRYEDMNATASWSAFLVSVME